MIEEIDVLCQHAFGEVVGEREAGGGDADAAGLDVTERDSFSIDLNGVVG